MDKKAMLTGGLIFLTGYYLGVKGYDIRIIKKETK